MDKIEEQHWKCFYCRHDFSNPIAKYGLYRCSFCGSEDIEKIKEDELERFIDLFCPECGHDVPIFLESHIVEYDPLESSIKVNILVLCNNCGSKITERSIVWDDIWTIEDEMEKELRWREKSRGNKTEDGKEGH